MTIMSSVQISALSYFKSVTPLLLVLEFLFVLNEPSQETQIMRMGLLGQDCMVDQLSSRKERTGVVLLRVMC